MKNLHLFFILVCIYTILSISNGLKFFKPNILFPPISQKPFVSVWNIDTSRCNLKYNISIDLSSFDIVINRNQTRNGENMVIFYSKQLGYYPHFDNNSNPLYGGIPQFGNISKHLQKCFKDIEAFIPNRNFSGLAVIDWESWRPLWDRNGWGRNTIYQNASINKVKFEHPNWSKDAIISEAKHEFETAAKQYMLETLKLAKWMRPQAQWGYYKFPDCFNYAQMGSVFTCTNATIEQNNEIEWLFDASTALFPSIYLGIWFKNNPYAAVYTANRYNEARRVNANRPSNTSIPIYVYNNLVYRKTREFLLLNDIKDSSGVAAMLGASGVVLWADYMDNSKNICLKLSNYVSTTLGPYLKSLSDTARNCSLKLCNGHGRCVLQQIPFKMHEAYHPFLKLFLQHFPDQSNNYYQTLCQCYPGYSGKNCEIFSK